MISIPWTPVMVLPANHLSKILMIKFIFLEFYLFWNPNTIQDHSGSVISSPGHIWKFKSLF